MLPAQFIKKWAGSTLKERSAAQEHFIDLCQLIGHPTPAEVDPDGSWFCFEKGAKKTGGGDGWADVWKKGFFAWEYKGKHNDLTVAFAQLQRYAIALENPPLLVVSDMETIAIHTSFTNTIQDIHTIALEDIGTPENLQKLQWLFNEPERFRPGRTTFAITEVAAARMGEIAKRLTDRGLDPHTVAHFLIQCVFCMFAEDARLLPQKLFETVLDRSNPDGSKAQARLAELFETMRDGGDFALNEIPWFNGGLFKVVDIPPLQTTDVMDLLTAARMDWSAVEPAILGTLFERGLNPDMRSQLGAHYTDPDTILKLIRPVIAEPLLAEWVAIKPAIAANMEKHRQGGKGSQSAFKDAQTAFIGFLERIKAFRVLDPACGSGNFLYLSLKALKDLEHRVNLEAEAMDIHRQFTVTSPANVLGIELNPYAAELARVTVWIGEIQWMLAHGYPVRTNPILDSLDHIECRDAVLIFDHNGDPDAGTLVGEPEWPEVDAIVGNPPFLGDKKMLGELPEDYVWALRHEYDGRVPGGADFVTYWFEKARAHIEQGKAKRAGLVATNSIRQKRNRPVLERIVASGGIFEAWSDEEWVNAGAAVRVSLVCFGGKTDAVMLDGQSVAAVHADLTAGRGLDLTLAKPLKENAGGSYFGLCLAGPFKVSSDTARGWLKLPNPHSKPNSDVLKPIYNGFDITRRWAGDWVIDFGLMDEQQAALYEVPFAYVVEHVKPDRIKNNRKARAEKWWRHGEARPGMRAKLAGLKRYIVTPETAKHRFFVWLPYSVAPEHRLVVIPREDDATLGILSSRIHVVWALAIGGTLEDRPVYNSTLCFETFPFPEPSWPQTIANAAHRLNELREAWLNPPEWTEHVPEVLPGYPDRTVAKPGYETDLKERTLTNLYNQRKSKSWLDNAHKELDAAVAVAYGWADYTPEMPDEEILRRLLALNLKRSKGE